MSDATPPTPSRAAAGSFAVVGAANVLRRHLDARLSRLGLSTRHVSVLGHVRAQPGVSIAELARRSAVTTQSMHSTVHDLLAAGALATDEPLRRGRPGPLRLTADGDRVLAAALAAVEALDRETGLDEVDAGPLVAAVARLAGRPAPPPGPGTPPAAS